MDTYSERKRKEYENRLCYVRRAARDLIEENNYDDPECAYRECYHASYSLQSELSDLISFLVEVRINGSLVGTEWENTDYDFLWHWILVVPEVGIVDITGSQLNKSPLRILNGPPENWSTVRKILPSEMAPELDEVRDYLKWDGKYEKGEVFLPLLRVCQVRIFLDRKTNFYEGKYLEKYY